MPWPSRPRGDYFEHNYGHGKQHLSAVLVTLLAYLMYAVLNFVDRCYPRYAPDSPRGAPSSSTCGHSVQYLPFDTWEHLFDLMLDGLGPVPPRLGGSQTQGKGKF
jgi:hypothetical protein